MRDLVVGGITPLTSVDFPGCLSAVVFLQGCPWRCGYCHNPHLLPADGAPATSWPAVKEFLRRRRGLLDAVVFSGGEPTLQERIPEAVSEARGMGFKVGLHTGGAYPRRLRSLLPLLDWVGMDIKTRFENYAEITGREGSGQKARESARLLIESGVPHEFRTTYHPLLLGADRLLALARDLSAMGVKRWVLQEFRPQGCASETLRTHGPARLIDNEFYPQVRELFGSSSLEVRPSA